MTKTAADRIATAQAAFEAGFLSIALVREKINELAAAMREVN